MVSKNDKGLIAIDFSSYWLVIDWEWVRELSFALQDFVSVHYVHSDFTTPALIYKAYVEVAVLCDIPLFLIVFGITYTFGFLNDL